MGHNSQRSHIVRPTWKKLRFVDALREATTIKQPYNIWVTVGDFYSM